MQLIHIDPKLRVKIGILSFSLAAIFLFDNYRKYLKSAERIIHETVIKNQQAQLNSVLNEQDAGLLIVELKTDSEAELTEVIDNNNSA